MPKALRIRCQISHLKMHPPGNSETSFRTLVHEGRRKTTTRQKPALLRFLRLTTGQTSMFLNKGIITPPRKQCPCVVRDEHEVVLDTPRTVRAPLLCRINVEVLTWGKRGSTTHGRTRGEWYADWVGRVRSVTCRVSRQGERGRQSGSR